jgi:hypothetical protein
MTEILLFLSVFAAGFACGVLFSIFAIYAAGHYKNW